MSIDFDRALTLMSVMEKVATVAPKATSILGLAQRELNDLNDEAKAIGVELAAAEAAAIEAAKPKAIPAPEEDEDDAPAKPTPTPSIPRRS